MKLQTKCLYAQQNFQKAVDATTMKSDSLFNLGLEWC